MTRETATERLARDLAFMRQPHRWPNRPLLPLKLRNGQPQDRRWTGLLFDNGQPTVYFGNLWHLPEGTSWKAILSTFESKPYTSFEELVADYTVD